MYYLVYYDTLKTADTPSYNTRSREKERDNKTTDYSQLNYISTTDNVIISGIITT